MLNDRNRKTLREVVIRELEFSTVRNERMKLLIPDSHDFPECNIVRDEVIIDVSAERFSSDSAGKIEREKLRATDIEYSVCRDGVQLLENSLKLNSSPVTYRHDEIPDYLSRDPAL
jgi:hypothetical protein